MADNDGEDGYPDEDLDALPSDVFQALQQNAVISTQQRQYLVSGNQQSHGEPYALEIPHGPNGQLNHRLKPGSHAITNLQPSSDYGDLDDELLDGEVFDAAEHPDVVRRNDALPTGRVVNGSTEREQWQQQRYSAPIPVAQTDRALAPFSAPAIDKTPSYAGLEDSGYAEVERAEDMLLDEPFMDEESAPRDAEDVSLDSLKAQVAQLLHERESIQQKVQESNDQLLAKAGEISIIRANQTKTSKEYERQLAGLQKLHIDEVARQKAEIENAQAERDIVLTENKFLKNDVQEVSRLRKVPKGAKEAFNKVVLPTTTANGTPRKDTTLPYRESPKRNTTLPYGDGFDVDEINFVSPSKSNYKGKALTPKTGTKRKRKVADDSPTQLLELSQPMAIPVLDDTETIQQEHLVKEAIKSVHDKGDERFEFTREILNHRRVRKEKRTFELLANYSFPSNPELALSTMLLDKMSSIRVEKSIDEFAKAFSTIVLGLWSQCITEKHYKPLLLLLDLYKFLLLTSPPTIAIQLVDETVVLAQQTADINVIPRTFEKPSSEIDPDVDTTECLSILQLTASLCARRKENITRFWRSIRFDFVLMMLRNVQPLIDIQYMLLMLRTSILDSTFAMIVTGEAKQPKCEILIIDKLTYMLITAPKVRKDQETKQQAGPKKSYTPTEITELRLQILSLLQNMCNTTHGAEALARNPWAIGRLVRTMNDELHALYDHDSAHELRAELINESTRLLYHLTSHPHYSTLIDMQEKLRAVPGGQHKHLIALSRLAFSEGIFFESGIEDDVVEIAHRMLEESVTPEEGEALLAAFSSARK
ncbi:hypothetical protein MMC09_003558 [Bachmanniomyces sp. S44760]|nr:hypothetical protein [Bachmanniomyces sp. S44760]